MDVEELQLTAEALAGDVYLGVTLQKYHWLGNQGSLRPSSLSVTVELNSASLPKATADLAALLRPEAP